LFTTLPIRSATELWDKWADVSGPDKGKPDGTVNMRDINWEIQHFNTFGEPPNRTLVDINQLQIDDLNLRIDNLNSSLGDLRSEVEGINATNLMLLIDTLNFSLVGLRSDLDDTNLSLTKEIEFRNSNDSALATDILALRARLDTLDTQVATMNATLVAMNTTILQLQDSYSSLNDTVSSLVSQLAILQSKVNNTLTMVWDSGWYGSASTGDTVINFGKTLNITDAVVYMYGKKTTTDNPHQIDYGGYSNGLYYYGAYWLNLTPTSITFHRHGNDVNWVYVRIEIWQKVTL
jgi:uncharacterized coiled-coil protein SlyX